MKNTSDFLVERLEGWGIKRIYGYPGDGINGIMGALERANSKFEFIQVRHEEMAAFMACAHAKFTGEIGVCLATSGPGAIHLLNGLYDAKMDNQPVLAIVGQQSTMALGGDFQQEVDLKNLFKDVAHEYIELASSPVQVRHILDRAIRIAKANKTVTCIIIPNDIQEQEAVEMPPRVHGALRSGIGYREPKVVPQDNDLKAAADILNAGNKVAIIVGAGALNAQDEVIKTANKLGAGVAKALLGKAALPDHLHFVTGTMGLLGTKPSYEMLQNCDTLFMIGSNFPYSEFLPKEGSAKGVQIDIKAGKLSLRYPMDVNLVGDSAETLRALMPYLKEKTDQSWRKQIEKNVSDWWKVMERRAMTSANPINPQRVIWEMSARLPSNAILTADAGSVANWYALYLKIQKGMLASLSGNLATMGSAVPYAIAAKFAYPDRPVIALVGDGAMQMNGLNELITVKKYWQQWKDPRLIFMVLNNRDLNQVTWEQRVLSGDPKYPGSQNIPDFPYASYAETIGLSGKKIEKPEELASVWEEALSANKPFVFEAYTDPDVPPLPPHITLEQAKAYMSSLLKGEPNLMEVIKQSSKQLWQGFRPK